MSLTQALATAVSGLRATQAGLSIVAANVANAETPGYVRKTASPGADRRRRPSASASASPRSIASSISTSSARCGWKARARPMPACARNSTTGCRSIYGVPGAVSTLETAYNEFMSALQVLSTSPEIGVGAQRGAQRRAGAGAAAQRHDRRHPGAAQRCRARARRRGDAGQRGDAADRRRSTGSSATASAGDATTANLLDQRDVYIDQLAQLMDINVVRGDYNQVIGLHQFRHPAGRHRGVDAGVRRRRAR